MKKTTKVIDSAGKDLKVPIKHDDQTVGVTISGGPFTGTLQFAGMIGFDGNRTELVPYTTEGVIADTTAGLPLDLFFNVGGYSNFILSAPGIVEGEKISVTIFTSEARRARTNSTQSNSGVDSEGNPLPANFCSWAVTYTYENSLIKTEVKTDGTTTYTRTYAFNMDKTLASVSQWVRS